MEQTFTDKRGFVRQVKVLTVTSIVVEQDSFQIELRIAGNSNKLVYFHELTSQVYNSKLLHIKINLSYK